MPMTRPTLPELLEQTASGIESRLPGVLARVRRTVVGVLARVWAGGLWGLYGYAEYLDRQKWPDTAEGAYLDDHGARWGVTRKAAQAANGTARLTGANGSAVPVDTVLQRADGVQYRTTADVVVAGGQALPPVVAVVPGRAGNALVNTGLQLVSPIAGVNTAGLAHTALGQGSDLEGDEAYRSRVLRRIRQVPHGGAAHDYEAWTLEVPGVTRAWVYPLEDGDGTVKVRFARDEDLSIIPDAPEVATVQAYLNARRPTTAIVTVLAPAAQVINFTLHVSPDTPEVRAAVQDELADLLRDPAENVPGGTVLITHIREAVSTAVGESDHVLHQPAANVVLPANTLAVVGAFTWV